MLEGIHLVNLTPHAIVIEDSESKITVQPSGTVSRVASKLTHLGNGLYTREWGEVVDLPEPKEDTIYIVSAMVAGRVSRADVASPATDIANRDENGRITSVPGLVVSK